MVFATANPSPSSGPPHIPAPRRSDSGSEAMPTIAAAVPLHLLRPNSTRAVLVRADEAGDAWCEQAAASLTQG